MKARPCRGNEAPWQAGVGGRFPNPDPPPLNIDICRIRLGLAVLVSLALVGVYMCPSDPRTPLPNLTHRSPVY